MKDKREKWDNKCKIILRMVLFISLRSSWHWEIVERKLLLNTVEIEAGVRYLLLIIKVDLLLHQLWVPLKKEWDQKFFMKIKKEVKNIPTLQYSSNSTLDTAQLIWKNTIVLINNYSFLLLVDFKIISKLFRSVFKDRTKWKIDKMIFKEKDNCKKN